MARWDVAARRYIEIVSSLQIAGKMLSLRGHYKPGSTSKWRPNYGLDHYSLIKPKNSLIAKFHSLLGGKKYPVRSGRELASKPLMMLREFTAQPALHSAAECNSLYFPGLQGIGLLETSSQETPPSSGESVANSNLGASGRSPKKWLRIAIETSNGTIRSYPPRISRTRARMPARSGGCTRVLCRDAHFHLGDAVDQV
jgi:hypothetical protein